MLPKAETRDPTIAARVAEILHQGLEVQVGEDTDVLVTGLLDSLTFVEILVRLEEAFEVEVDVEHLDIEDFRSVGAITSFLEKRFGIV